MLSPENISHLVENPIRSCLLSVAGAWIVYNLATIVYNLFFHPLRHIPGPRLAAATYLLEFYYDVVKLGRYTRHIQWMHKKYGPIIRINPNEVHCNDSLFLDEIYAKGSRKRDKPEHQVRGSGMMQNAIFATQSHDIHRMRRGGVGKFFSRAQVSRLESKMRGLAQSLCDKILVLGNGIPLDVTTAYSHFTSDVISDYCFGESLGLLAQPGWGPNFREPVHAMVKPMFVFRFFPSLRYLAAAMASKHLTADMALLHKTLVVDMPARVRKAQADNDAGINKGSTIFGSLLESSLPAEEKSVQRITQEATSFFSAGTDSVSWALTVVTYHLLAEPGMLQRLTAELNQNIDSSGQIPPWATLESLPYLGAVISEGLRLSYGISSRSARIPTCEDLIYHGHWTPAGSDIPKRVEYFVPRGYAIGMSAYITHHDERIFTDSHSFLPERWLDENNQRKKQLDRALLSFGKGSRNCIGMNLAYCELYVLLSFLTLRVFPRMRLYETTVKDIAYDYEMNSPFPVSTSKGVRAIIA